MLSNCVYNPPGWAVVSQKTTEEDAAKPGGGGW